MKILLVHKYFYPRSGADNSFFQTVELLKKNGHKVSIFSMRHPRNLPSEYDKFFVNNVDYDDKNAIHSIHYAVKLLYSFHARRKIEALIRQERPDIAHINNIYHQISPSIIHSLKKYRIPMVMTLRDYKLVCASYSMFADNGTCEACKSEKFYQCVLKKCVKDSRLKSFLNALEMYFHHSLLHIYNQVDVFISPSRFLKAKTEEMGFQGRIEYLPNFVQVDEYRPQFDWQERSIVYFGRLSREKGLVTLLKAMQGLPDITLKLIGEGPLRGALEQETENLKLKNVEFLGYKNKDELNEEIKKSMFVVLPSEWYENNPRTIIEGFALGKSAVGARIGGIPELVRDNETGLLFEPGNVGDLKQKIAMLAADSNKIKAMGKNGRQFVEQELNEKKHYAGLMRIYERAIAGS